MAPPHSAAVVVMGVSGAGKSTLARALARRRQRPFVEGDALHPSANVEKMRAGVALDDEDRGPWLQAVGAWLAANPGGVASCSALKRAHRDVLRAAAPDVFFIHVDAPRDELERRLSTREGHFMPASLLDSQLEALEPLQPDEAGVVVDATAPLDELVLRLSPG